MKIFDNDALLAQFQGYSLFTIFVGEIYLFHAVFAALQGQEFEDRNDGVDMVEHPDLRRFIQILSQRQCVLEQEKEEEEDSTEPTKAAIKP